MATRTSRQIQGDIYGLLQGSTLATMLSGGVYREGTRPKDSWLEDAVVIFTTGVPTQVQEGIVTVDIYVPDIDPYDDGTLAEDGERCEEVETLAQAWVDDLTAGVSNYLFELSETIHTNHDPDINQSFVVVKLGYKYFDE